MLRDAGSFLYRGSSWVEKLFLRLNIRPLSLLELLLVTLWALWVGRSSLNFSPSASPHGGDFALTIQPNAAWSLLGRCGLCMLWNGSLNGGFPALVETHSGFLHPLVALTTLIWGTLNGAKITLLLSLAMAGWAQWWIARSLGLGFVARMWTAGMAVVGGHLAGRMELGLVGIILSTAACSLAIAAALNLAYGQRQTAVVALAVTIALALFSGQGYAQIGLFFGVFPALAVFCFERDLRPNRLLRQYASSFGLGLLLAGILLIPLAHFSPNFGKEIDDSLRSAQPLEYLFVNLIVRDTSLFHTEALGKMLFPAIYINYIGWFALILAVAAIWLTPPDKRRALVFFASAAALVALLSSRELIYVLSSVLPTTMGMYRYPPLVAGLLVPLILGMAGMSIDRLLRSRLPAISLDTANGTGRHIPLAWALLSLPLALSLIAAYRFGQAWLVSVDVPHDIRELGSRIPNPGSAWIEPPKNSHQWVVELVEDGHKVTNVFRPWHWKARPYPAPAYQAFSPEDEILRGEVFTTIDAIRVVRYPEIHYAQVESDVAEPVPCEANARGGLIDVVCSAETSGRLVLQENMFPGWSGYRDSEKIELIGDEQIEVEAPSGDHVYRFRYYPFDFLLGAIVSLVGVALCVAAIARERRPGSALPDDQPPARAQESEASPPPPKRGRKRPAREA